MTPAVAAADWGTTRLRLWLLDDGGEVLAEKRSDEGMLAARPDRFGSILERMLSELQAPADVPVVICGMAGARQGWVEAPYVDVPTRLDAIFEAAIRIPGQPRDVRIVPGVAQKGQEAPDVMRGEETQLAGAAATLPAGSSLVCLPGTHSKWAEIADGAITGFQTIMTGELYAALSTHTILSHSLGGEPLPVPPEHALFLQACAEAARGAARTETHLFRLRAGMLLNGLGQEDASATLSGLLIGCEIAAARERFPAASNGLTLVASGLLRDLYAAAFDACGLTFASVDADEAVRAGLLAAANHLGMTTRGHAA